MTLLDQRWTKFARGMKPLPSGSVRNLGKTNRAMYKLALRAKFVILREQIESIVGIEKITQGIATSVRKAFE